MAGPLGPISTDIAARILPWRFTTPLHKGVGARAIRSRILLPAGIEFSLASFMYGVDSLDRVIGVRYVNLNATAVPDAITNYGARIALGNSLWFREANTDTHYPFAANNYTCALTFNVETLNDGIDMRIETALSHWCEISLYNFEVGATYVGY